MDTPRQRCNAAIEIALAEIAADRECSPDDLSVRVLRAIEGAVLDAYRLGAESVAGKRVSGTWDFDSDRKTPVIPVPVSVLRAERKR